MNPYRTVTNRELNFLISKVRFKYKINGRTNTNSNQGEVVVTQHANWVAPWFEQHIGTGIEEIISGLTREHSWGARLPNKHMGQTPVCQVLKRKDLTPVLRSGGTGRVHQDKHAIWWWFEVILITFFSLFFWPKQRMIRRGERNINVFIYSFLQLISLKSQLPSVHASLKNNSMCPTISVWIVPTEL